jgi:hypothetical protein
VIDRIGSDRIGSIQPIGPHHDGDARFMIRTDSDSDCGLGGANSP